MSSDGSVTLWLQQLREGESHAAQQLWEDYFRRLVGLARRKLEGRQLALADEEDVALSAIRTFCEAMEQGQFPTLDDLDDLWQVLVMLTARKAARAHRTELSQKAGKGNIVHFSALGDDDATVLSQVMGNEPSTEFADELLKEFINRLAIIDREHELPAVALLKLQGCSNIVIAERLNISLRTVERRLFFIRRLWSEE